MTHAELVLELLSDGEPHSHHEGYRLGVMLHSRVSNLRKRGYEIRCWRDGNDYLYQLGGRDKDSFASGEHQSPPDNQSGTVREGDGADGGGASPLGPSRHGPPDAGPGLSPETPPGPAQLSVFEAAA